MNDYRLVGFYKNFNLCSIKLCDLECTVFHNRWGFPPWKSPGPPHHEEAWVSLFFYKKCISSYTSREHFL